MKRINTIEELRQFTLNINCFVAEDEQRNNYEHNVTRIHHDPNTNSGWIEELCINEYGSAYGLNTYGYYENTHINPDLLFADHCDFPV